MNKFLTDVPFNLKNPVHFLAVGFGSGLLKKAPGTWGTLMAIPVYFYLLTELSFANYCIAIVGAFLAGIFICGKTARDIGEHDHGAIVWDEFVGLWLTLSFIPVHWIWISAGFVLFRFFDIVKPFPIGFLDRKIHGGFGTMLDDVLAALYAMGCLHVLMGAYKLYLGIA